nr:hypothetical protein [Lysinibacillus timonensis]
MKKLMILCTFLLIITGCNMQEELSENAKIASIFLENKGYEIISYERETKYHFSSTELDNKDFDLKALAVQSGELEQYLDKEIQFVTFTVKNHPLDVISNENQTILTVWLIEKNIVGGTSMPYSSKNDLVGGPYSLDGKTVEEMVGEYNQWYEEIQSKFNFN